MVIHFFSISKKFTKPLFVGTCLKPEREILIKGLYSISNLFYVIINDSLPLNYLNISNNFYYICQILYNMHSYKSH